MGVKLTVGRVTVDSVVKNIQSSIEDLEQIALAKSREIDVNARKLDELTEKNRLAFNEQQHANRVKQKLLDLIS